jgi:3-carboxy-cis,cis-muconate cycloisomerase
VALAERSPDIHRGAASRDIIDTAMMLVSKRAMGRLLADADGAAGAAGLLARRHRDTPVLGMTLLQPALPSSFGLRAAGWMTAIDRACAGLRELPRAVQMGGPVGRRDPAMAARVAAELRLAEPVLPWHTDRVRPARLACGLVAAVSVLACTRRTPGLVATMLASMEQELERAAGAWQAEWGTIAELLALTGSAAAWARDMLENLEVDGAAMRAGAGRDPDLGSAPELVDRALEARSG